MTRSEWRSAVFAYPELKGSVKVLLLYLADHMQADLTASVPRTKIAADLNVSLARVTERMRMAREAGLIETVTPGGHGRHVAVYRATKPASEVAA